MLLKQCINYFMRVCVYREALQVATFIRKMAKRQTTRFSGHLEIGEELKIPCKIFTRVSVLSKTGVCGPQ